MLNNNLLALIVTLTLSWAWLRINDFAAHRGWISSQMSRKIIHIGTGPLYVLCWLLFRNDASARYFAALVPLAITAQFFAVGVGLIKDEAAVKALSRSGNRREILRGPLYYGIIFVLMTVIFWYDSPVGIVALMLLCGGDGLADIFGRRFGRKTIPWNKGKSWAGSLAMFAGGWAFAVAVVGVFVAAGIFAPPLTAFLLPITLIALAGAVVETLPTPEMDNITVTAVAVLLGMVLF